MRRTLGALIFSFVLIVFTLLALTFVTQDSLVRRPSFAYSHICEYYDNRRCVVTLSLDDFGLVTENWRRACELLSELNIGFSIGVITLRPDEYSWEFLDNLSGSGLVEIASHSRTHKSPICDTLQEINGSRDDIIRNLKSQRYVYTWIEPNNAITIEGRKRLGLCGYLVDRSWGNEFAETESLFSVPIRWNWSDWDQEHGLYRRIGALPIHDETDLETMNSWFDHAYHIGGIYCSYFHPQELPVEKSSVLYDHLDYIGNRKDVWYVPLGSLYAYHFIEDRSVIEVDSIGIDEFRLTIDSSCHNRYGTSYPLTYVFNVLNSNLSDITVLYRHDDTRSWQALEGKGESDFFNGRNAYRTNQTEGKIYVSVGFNESDDIYLKFCSPDR